MPKRLLTKGAVRHWGVTYRPHGEVMRGAVRLRLHQLQL